MGGPCDAIIEGETMEEVAKKGGDHIQSTTDEAHASLREQMATGTPEDKNKWFSWFKGVWDQKS